MFTTTYNISLNIMAYQAKDVKKNAVFQKSVKQEKVSVCFAQNTYVIRKREIVFLMYNAKRLEIVLHILELEAGMSQSKAEAMVAQLITNAAGDYARE